MVSFTSLCTVLASVSAVAIPQADTVFAKRATCDIIDVSKLLVSVDDIVHTVLGATDLSGDAALVNKLVADVEVILSSVDAECLGGDVNKLVESIVAGLNKLLGSL